jgi:hypothetical protein
MRNFHLEEIEVSELFKISTEDRVALIEWGVNNVIENCQKLSKITGEKTSKLLNETLWKYELKVKELAEEEQYELSYYFNELIWGVHRRLEQIKEDKGE